MPPSAPDSSAKPDTILFVIFSLARAGAEVALFELAASLDRSRYRPVVISLGPPAELSEDFAKADIPVHYLGMTSIRQAPLAFFKALYVARREQPAITHGFMFYGDLTARLLRMCRATPRVVSALHSVKIGKRWTEVVMRVTDPLSDAATAVSQAVATAQLAARSVRSSKLEVIENGIDLRRFEPPDPSQLEQLRRKLGLAPHDRIVLSVGRLIDVKNHAGMLRVMARLGPRHTDVRLLIAGSGPLEGALRAQAEQLGLSHRVCFAGPLSPIAPAFFLADVFLLASFHEGLPLVVLEAMAASRAMVLTAVGGIPEVIEHEKTGLLVPPSDDEALLQALQRMLELGPERRARFGEAAREEVVRHYSIQRVTERTEALYARLSPNAAPV